jgi:uncharacterized Zn-finger protein
VKHVEFFIDDLPGNLLELLVKPLHCKLVLSIGKFLEHPQVFVEVEAPADIGVDCVGVGHQLEDLTLVVGVGEHRLEKHKPELQGMLPCLERDIDLDYVSFVVATIFEVSYSLDDTILDSRLEGCN